MATSSQTIPTLTPDNRRVAVESYERANQVIANNDYDYGIRLLLTCCKLDPTNLTFRKKLRKTQKLKHNNNMRGSRLATMSTLRTRSKLKSAKNANDYLMVLELAEEILTHNPWDSGVQLDMAWAFEGLEQVDLAIYIMDQAREKDPHDVNVNRALARLLEKRGNFLQAMKLWQMVLEKLPQDKEAGTKAKDLAARETIAKGNYEGVLSDSQLDVGTANQAALADTAVANPSPSRLEREVAPLLEKIHENPTNARLYLQLASIYQRSNETEKAREILQQGLAPTGNDFLIQIELLEMDLVPLRKNIELIESKMVQQRAAPEESKYTAEQLENARNRHAKELRDREIELYRLKADRFPQETIHRIRLAESLIAAGKLDEAITELQVARKDVRVQWQANMHLGIAFARRNNWRLALRNLEEALDQMPSEMDEERKAVLFELANGYAQSKDLPKAIEFASDLANLDFNYRGISKLLDEWSAQEQSA
ncbi:MAG: tetratricopeptide repeat protein [Zavarzinella sp.]